MAFPTVERCFCCLSLRTAGYLMGLMGIIVNLASIYLYIAIKKVNDNTLETNDTTNVGKWEIVMSCVGLLIDLSWIYGIHRKRPKPMLPFLILAFIGAIILILAPFGSLFYFSATNENPIVGSVTFFLLFCLGGLAFYLLIVQYSIYKLIRKSAVDKIDQDNNEL